MIDLRVVALTVRRIRGDPARMDLYRRGHDHRFGTVPMLIVPDGV